MLKIIARRALIALALSVLPMLANAGPPKDPRLSGLPLLPKGAIVVTNILDGNCSASNQLDEPVEIKTKTAADCDKWLAAVAKAYKRWPSEAARALSSINSEPDTSGDHRLYAVAQCYAIPRLEEHCAITQATDPYGQPFESLKACQRFIVKYLAPEVPENGKFALAGGNWYECASRPNDRWQVPK